MLKKAAVLILVLALVMTFSMTVMAGSNGSGVDVLQCVETNRAVEIDEFNDEAAKQVPGGNPLDVAGN